MDEDPLATLENQLALFIAGLDADLDALREVAPRFVSLFTETTLSVLTLEYALRRKGVLDDDELTQAIVDAQDALQRIRRRRGGVPSAGLA
jgi:hypothetical protein